MPGLASSISTNQDYIPAINSSQIGKFAGVAMHFPDFATFTAAVTTERGNVSISSGIWADGQPMSISSEPKRARRTWSVSLNHARTVTVGSATFVLAADSNVVLAATGAPSSGTGSNGDISVDEAAGVVYQKASGAWAFLSNFNGLSAMQAAAAAAGFTAVTAAATDTATVTANTAAIQAAWNAGLLDLTWLGNATVYVNNTLVIKSRSHARLGNAEIRMLAGTNKTLLKTDAHANGSDTSVTITWTSGFQFNVQWTAHGQVVNNVIAIQGSLIGTGANVGDRIFNGCFRVDAVVDANNVTCTLDRLPTATPSGSAVARQCTTDFVIEGGRFNYDQANNPGATGIDLMGINIGYASRFVARNLRPINSTKYGVYFFCISWFDIGDIFNNNAVSDGVKIFSPAKHGVVDGIDGFATDDCFTLQSNAAAAYAQYTVTQGDLYSIKIRNVRGGSSSGVVFGIYLWAGYYVDDIQVDGVSGNALSVLCQIATDAGNPGGNFEGITISNVMGGPTYGFRCANVGLGKALRLQNVNHQPNGITNLPGWVIANDATITKLIVDGFQAYSTGWQPVSAYYTAQVSGAVEDIVINDANITLPGAGRGIQFNGTGLKRLVFNRLRAAGGAGGNIIDMSASGTPRVRFNDTIAVGGAASCLISPTAACSVHIDGGNFSGLANGVIRPNGAFMVTGKISGSPTFTSSPLWAVFGGATVWLDDQDAVIQALAFSATPAPNASLGSIITMTLTANITSMAVPTSLKPNQLVTFILTQNGSGGFTTAWAAGFIFGSAWSDTGNTAGLASTVTFRESGGKLYLVSGQNKWG